MTKKKTELEPVVAAPDEVWRKVDEITNLVKIRQTLSYGTNTSIRKDAESTMSRAISNRVDELSKIILDTFKD